MLIETFVAVVTAFETIKNNVDKSWNSDSVRDVCSQFHATISFQLIIALVVVSNCLEVTRPLTKQLQFAAFDAVAANAKITGIQLYAVLKKLRLNVSDVHTSSYDKAVALAGKVGTEPTMPRIVHRQIYRANQPADSVSEYFRRIVSIPFLHHLISQIQMRFSDRNTTLMNAYQRGLQERLETDVPEFS